MFLSTAQALPYVGSLSNMVVKLCFVKISYIFHWAAGLECG